MLLGLKNIKLLGLCKSDGGVCKHCFALLKFTIWYWNMLFNIGTTCNINTFGLGTAEVIESMGVCTVTGFPLLKLDICIYS